MADGRAMEESGRERRGGTKAKACVCLSACLRLSVFLSAHYPASCLSIMPVRARQSVVSGVSSGRHGAAFLAFRLMVFVCCCSLCVFFM